MLFCLQNCIEFSRSVFNSALEFTVMARHEFPRTSFATFTKNVESTPPENATAHLPKDFNVFLRFSYFR